MYTKNESELYARQKEGTTVLFNTTGKVRPCIGSHNHATCDLQCRCEQWTRRQAAAVQDHTLNRPAADAEWTTTQPVSDRRYAIALLTTRPRTASHVTTPPAVPHSRQRYSCYSVEDSIKQLTTTRIPFTQLTYWLLYSIVAPVNCYKVYNS